jgi:hypothetical protein
MVVRTASITSTPLAQEPKRTGIDSTQELGSETWPVLTGISKDDFIYDAEAKVYRCPAGERLTWRYVTIERELKLHRYWSSNCQQCSLKDKCTPSIQRRVTRWEHEEVLEEMQIRLDHSPDMMRGVEMWRGSSRFGLSVAASSVWRCPNDFTLTPFPHPAHRTGHADLPHPALGQDITPSYTAGSQPWTGQTHEAEVPIEV